jgi:hypothetical protein
MALLKLAYIMGRRKHQVSGNQDTRSVASNCALTIEKNSDTVVRKAERFLLCEQIDLSVLESALVFEIFVFFLAGLFRLLVLFFSYLLSRKLYVDAAFD